MQAGRGAPAARADWPTTWAVAQPAAQRLREALPDELHGHAGPGQVTGCLVLHCEVVADCAAGLAEALRELSRRQVLKVGYCLSQLGLNVGDLLC